MKSKIKGTSKHEQAAPQGKAFPHAELPEVETMRRGVLPISSRVDLERPLCQRRPILLTPRIDAFDRRVRGKRIADVVSRKTCDAVALRRPSDRDRAADDWIGFIRSRIRQNLYLFAFETGFPTVQIVSCCFGIGVGSAPYVC